ncbi:MAG: GntR family transcriptional regulator [Dehalococcoidia bacterium]
MENTSWPKISQTTLADQVYRAIRARILDADMTPGEFVREQEVSSALGVSRTPVREALGRLASEGFLERIPHRGFRVPEQALGGLLELYPIVSSLELLAGRLSLPNVSKDDVRQLRDINRRLEQSRGEGDVRTLIELNNEFHHVFCRRSGNRRLCDMLDDMRSQINRLELWFYSQSARTEESVHEHDEMIEAIEAGDHERALAILENNMALTYKRLKEDRALEQLDRTLSPPAST